MVIDFVTYVEMQKAQQLARDVERRAEALRRNHLEQVLSDLLADLQAA